jgi:hypothetical protein
VQSATTDLDEVAKWPLDINIGIATGHNDLMVFDVDDAEAASALLAPDAVLRDETGTAQTGRGVHVYFLCSGSHRTVHIRDKQTGRKIGHISGINTYVIAPPSKAPAGKLYRWLSKGVDDWIPSLAKVTDAVAYVKRLLSPHGIEAIQTAGLTIGEVPEDIEVEECDLPPKAMVYEELIDVKQRLRGGGGRVLEKDRSGWEHHIACRIIRALAARKVTYLPAMKLAGVIKKLDRVYYGKFEEQVEQGKRSRMAADKRYYVSALAALDAEGMPSEKPKKKRSLEAELEAELELESEGDATESSEVIGLHADPTYMWDDDTGYLYHVVRHKKSVSTSRIANFQVKLLTEITIDRDDANPEKAWLVRLTLASGEFVEMLLRASEFESNSALEKALSHRASHLYNIYPNSYAHLKAAIRELSKPEDVRRYSMRAVPGWWDTGEKHVYLLPNALGAIGAEGLDPELGMHIEDLVQLDDPIAQGEFAAYGKGVRVPSSREDRKLAWLAFEALVACGDLHVTVPIVLQILAGPLWSLGADEVPSLLHISGRTGVLKTSYCLAAMSIFGTFRKTTPPPASWPSSSPSALRLLLHTGKDLTILIDDYKEGAAYDPRGMRELIQSYADKSARQRLKSSGQQRKSLNPRAVILSNGEDAWGKEASMVARTIFIDIKDGDITDLRLARVQDSIERGELQLFGGAYLSWLARQSVLFEEHRVEALREKWHKKLLTKTTRRSMHRRLLNSASTLAAVGDILIQFTRECYPSKEPLVKKWITALLELLLKGSETRAIDVDRLAGAQQLLDQIVAGISAGQVCFMPARGLQEGHHQFPRRKHPDSPRPEVIGWWSFEKGIVNKKPRRLIHLNEKTTFGWYRRQLRQIGDEPLFSWESVEKDAISRYEAIKQPRFRVAIGEKKRSQLTVLTFPLSVLSIQDQLTTLQ